MSDRAVFRRQAPSWASAVSTVSSEVTSSELGMGSPSSFTRTLVRRDGSYLYVSRSRVGSDTTLVVASMAIAAVAPDCDSTLHSPPGDVVLDWVTRELALAQAPGPVTRRSGPAAGRRGEAGPSSSETGLTGRALPGDQRQVGEGRRSAWQIGRTGRWGVRYADCQRGAKRREKSRPH